MPIVTNPTAGDVHVNAPLTNFSQKYLQSEGRFVSLRAMPSIPVAKQSDLYYIFSREDFYRAQAQKRADGAESAGGGFRLSTTPYHCDVWAFHKDVTDRQRANQDSPVQLDNSAAQFVMLQLLMAREQDFLDTFFDPANWTGSVNIQTTALDGIGGATADDWAAATSDPIQQLRAAMRIIHGRTGYRPNRALFTRSCWDAFLDNDAVLDRIQGGATVDLPAVVMKRLVAQILEIDAIEVTDAVVNSAVRGATEATTFMGATGNDANEADQVLVYYAPMSATLEEPTAGVSFNWTGYLGATSNGQRIKRFRMEQNEADRVEGQMAFDHKLVAAELGLSIYNVL